MFQHFIFFFLILLSYSSNATVQDFCVADMSKPKSPTGFNCIKPSSVTVNDFKASTRAIPVQHSSLFNLSSIHAYVDQVPGLNGLGISMGRFEMEAGGVLPVHSHPGITELVVILSGSATNGFFSSDNTVYITDIKEGDVMVFPQGLLHFSMNTGENNASGLTFFSSMRPSTQMLDFSLFGSGLPTDLLSKVSFIDGAQIKKLKGVFGGTD